MNLMIKLFFLFLFGFTSAFSNSEVNECITDIWFGNGVWNTNLQAMQGKRKLSDKILYHVYHDNFDAMKEHHGKKIYLAYNFHADKMFDLMETFYQLKSSGQISDLSYIATVSSLLRMNYPGPIEYLDALTNKLQDILIYTEVVESNNLAKMVEDYKEFSFNLGHRVLLVAHSQGNIFGNRVYNKLGWEKDYFRMLSIATPANNVLNKNHPYVTLREDVVIGGIPGHLAGNVNNTAYYIKNAVPQLDNNDSSKHEFIPSYLNGNNTNFAIVNEFISLLNKIENLPSQWQPKKPTACMNNKMITVEHRFDSSLREIGDVYFVSDGKLRKESGRYVKAACSGALPGSSIPAIPTPHAGIVTVGMEWQSPVIDMDLTFDAGIKDIADLNTTALEHYYVEQQSDMPPGLYGIHAGYKGYVDESCLQDSPETILFSVSTPTAQEHFALTLKSVDELNIGHVADINVSEKGHDLTFPGGGDCNDCTNGVVRFSLSPGSGEQSLPWQYRIIPRLDQALAGPLGGAQFSLVDAFDPNRTVLFGGSTTYGGSTITTGLINMPKVFKADLEDEKLYLLTISGGEDIDVDDDLRIDTLPTTNQGSFHALLTGEEIKAGGFKINILTEAAYQVNKNFLETNTTEQILENMDDAAFRLLREDVNNDSEINHKDLYAWIPSFDKEKLYADYDAKVAPIVTKFYHNLDIYSDAYGLVYATALIESVSMNETQIDGNITLAFNGHTDPSMLGNMQIELRYSDGNVINGAVSVSGKSVVFDPSIDLEYGIGYVLVVVTETTGKDGNTYFDEYTYPIKLRDTFAPRFTSPETVALQENSRSVLTVMAEDISTPVTYSIVGGADRDLLDISASTGALAFYEAPDFENPQDDGADSIYEVQVRATDTEGNSAYQTINVTVENVPEPPSVLGFAKHLDENVSANTYVGTVTVTDTGDSAIEAFTIDSDDFDVDTNGTVSTKNSLDFETKAVHRLRITAVNKSGESNAAVVTVYLNNIIDTPPVLSDFTGSMSEAAIGGVEVGTLQMDEGDSAVTDIFLGGEGAADFSIDRSGTIAVADGAVLDHERIGTYNLTAAAVNSAGSSNEANVVIRINPWTIQYGTDASDTAFAMTEDSEGNIYIAGNTTGNLDPDTDNMYVDMFLSKFTSDGVHEWTKQSTANEDWKCAYSVDTDHNGNVIVAGGVWGAFDGTTHVGKSDVFIRKYRSDGTKLWTVQYGTGEDDEAHSVAVDSSGDIYVSGFTGSALDGNVHEGGRDVFLSKFDTDGIKLWTKQFGTSNSWEVADSVHVDSSGSIYVAGSTMGNLDGINAGDYDGFLSKFTSDGSMEWTKQFGTERSDTVASVGIDDDGFIYVAGGTEGDLDGNENIGNTDVYLSKFRPDGLRLWTRQYGGSGWESADSVSMGSEGSIYVVGSTDGNFDGEMHAGNGDLFLSRFNADGTKDWTRIYGTREGEMIPSVVADADGNVYISGTTYGDLHGHFNQGYSDVFLMKIAQ
jgi:hypothetical protein